MIRWLCIFWLAFSTIAHAIEPGEALSDPVLEERARIISAQLRCLTCQNQSIDDSPSEIAKDLRVMVRERLVAGDSNKQVLAFAVDRYGEFVLLKPKVALHTLLLWVSPFIFVALGGLFVWRLRQNRSNSRDIPNVALNSDEQAALDEIRRQ